VVPNKENNAVFWEILINCPAQNAQPLGAKLPPNIMMVAK
jgi:hypothetical protein